MFSQNNLNSIDCEIRVYSIVSIKECGSTYGDRRKWTLQKWKLYFWYEILFFSLSFKRKKEKWNKKKLWMVGSGIFNLKTYCIYMQLRKENVVEIWRLIFIFYAVSVKWMVLMKVNLFWNYITYHFRYAFSIFRFFIRIVREKYVLQHLR